MLNAYMYTDVIYVDYYYVVFGTIVIIYISNLCKYRPVNFVM